MCPSRDKPGGMRRSERGNLLVSIAMKVCTVMGRGEGYLCDPESDFSHEGGELNPFECQESGYQS